MPELPEVETVVRTLEKRLKDAEISKVSVFYDKLVDTPEKEEFEKKLEGEYFREFGRRGKYILITTDHYIWVSHLRMEGKFFVSKDELTDRHTHLKAGLKDGRFLYYKDTRKFGRMELYGKNDEITVIRKLGLEPFDPALTADYLKKKAKNRPLKDVLLDQTVIAGIGNIYANEIAFAIRRRPSVRFSRLSKREIGNLIDKIREILSEAIQAGGTTIRSYNPEPGITGLFQLNVNVHDRENEPCRICGTPVKKVMYHGRGTYYCMRCQK